jgi:2'-5' RNA ligase
MQKQPLILTLRLDPESQAYFDVLRKQYFPPERDYLQAHLTLFHQLPDEPATLNYFAELQHSPMELQVNGLINLGAGVAYRAESPELTALYRKISQNFAEVLIPQDRQPLRPHITVQNKTTPETARALLKELEEQFKPWTIKAIGLDLWTYLGGPWEHRQTFTFVEPGLPPA